MNGNANRFAAGLILVAAALAAACTPGSGSTPAPGTPARGTPAPTQTQPTQAPPAQASPTTPGLSLPSPTVTSAAHAAALVFASDPRWAQMVPLRADMVGQSSWYEAFEDGDGFAVNVTVGQGDCQAGCIERHVWHYHVDGAGNVELTGENGEDVNVPPGTGDEGDVTVVVQLTAEPTCAIEGNPPEPNCAAGAVANAEVAIFDAQGNEMGTATSNADGMAEFNVPQGAYFVVPGAVEGLKGVPEAQAFSGLGGDQVGLLFAYDTGIR